MRCEGKRKEKKKSILSSCSLYVSRNHRSLVRYIFRDEQEQEETVEGDRKRRKRSWEALPAEGDSFCALARQSHSNKEENRRETESQGSAT